MLQVQETEEVSRIKGVFCGNCVHYKKCIEARIALGIVNLVPGTVDCDRYVRKVMKNHKVLDRQGNHRHTEES